MAMRTINIHEAKTTFSRLVNRASAGERIVISRGGRPVAVLGPLDERPKQRVPGSDRGRIHIGRDFDEPLSEFEV